MDGDGRSAAPSRAAGARDLVEKARNLMTVERVFGEPVQRGAITLVPVASVRGGGGGGGGGGTNVKGEEGTGEGLGFAAAARPVGAYVMTDGEVRWRPALDVSRLVLAGCLVAVTAILAGLLTERSRARASVKIARRAS
jgi:uncharacterized spore protein YtfJ